MNNLSPAENDLVEARHDAESSTDEASPDARFTDYALAPDVLEALKGMGITVPTPIQRKVIGPILEGKDVIGKAETGTGKTIGFGGPLVGKIDTTRVAVQALVLTPTRELAQQVAGVIQQLGVGRNLRVALIVGGVHASEQILELRKGSQIVVGTPGRVLDLLGGSLSLVWCETVVVDEADRMFDMGFIDDITNIFERLPEERQTLLFSATVPPTIQKLMKKYMKNPEMFSTSSGLSTVEDIRQVSREVDFPRKFDELKRILDSDPEATCIIFTNTRHQAIDLDRMLWGHNYPARSLHGEHDQEVRFKTLEAFRQREVRILVATDVASRGLDIDDVGMVINYEVPIDAESYVHRIGRTGRASKSGKAITLVARKELPAWKRIVKTTGFDIQSETPATGRRRGGRGGEGGGRERGRSDRGRSGGRSEGGHSEGRSRRSRGRRRGSKREGAATGAESAAGPRTSRGDEKSKPPRGRAKKTASESSKSSAANGSRDKAPARRRPPPPPKKKEQEESVDLFDVSMKDFLDVSRPIDDFRSGSESREKRDDDFGFGTSPAKPARGSEPARDSKPAPDTAPASPAGDEADSAEKPSKSRRRRRRRRSGGNTSGGESASSSGGAAQSGGGEGSPSSPARKKRRRRRRPAKKSSGGGGEGGGGAA